MSGDFWDPAGEALAARQAREAHNRYYTGQHVRYLGNKPKELVEHERSQPVVHGKPEAEVPEAMLDTPEQAALAQEILDAFSDLEWAIVDECSKWKFRNRRAPGTSQRVECAKLILRGQVIIEQVTLSTLPYDDLVEIAKKRKAINGHAEPIPPPKTIWDVLKQPVTLELVKEVATTKVF